MENYLKRYIAVSGMPKAKVDKLLHYCHTEPRLFIQYDAFSDCEADSLIHPDEQGDWLSRGNTIELMSGSTVRILINPQSTKDEVIRLLHKIIDWIQRDPEALNIIDDQISEINLNDLENEDMPF